MMSSLPDLSEKVNEMCSMLKATYNDQACSQHPRDSFLTKSQDNLSLSGHSLDDPGEHDKAAMKALLLCHKGDVNVALNCYRTYKRIQYSQKMETINPLDPSVRDELLSGKFTIIPTSSNDSSSTEHLCIFFGHLHWPMDVILRDTIKMILMQLNGLVKLSASLEIVSVALILDLSQSQYSNFDMNLCTSLLYILKDHFPLRISRIFVIGMPPTLDTNRKILTRFLKSKIRNRMTLLESHLQLFQHMPACQLPRNLLPQGEGPEMSHDAWLRQCFHLLGVMDTVLRHQPQYFLTSPARDGLASGKSVTPYLSGASSVYLSRRFSSNSLKRTPRTNTATRNTLMPLAYCTFNPVSRRSASFHMVHSPVVSSSPLTPRMLPNMMNQAATLPHPPISGTASLISPQRYFPSSDHRNNNPSMSATSSDTEETQDLHSNYTNGQRMSTLNGSNLRHLLGKSAHQEHKKAASVFQPNSTGLTVDQLQEMVAKKGEAGLLSEYAEICRTSHSAPCEVSKKVENRGKCRYSDVPCVDATRVKLPPRDGFIHANWVDGYKEKNMYISAQGPLESTAEDFWCMVMHYKVPVIVMVTKLVEKERTKCYQYWPTVQLESITFGSYVVMNEGVEVTADFTVTKLRVKVDHQGEIKHRVLHYHFTNWPDYDIPGNPHGFLEFVERVQCVWNGMMGKYRESTSATTTTTANDGEMMLPIVVHCSAGIGRSGTFIVVDICIRRLRDQGLVDIKRVVQLIRTQRLGSIQMPRQYVFIHVALLTYADKHRDLIARALASSSVGSDDVGVGTLSLNT